MKKAEIVKSVNGLFSKTSFQLKKHSPEILVVAGVIGVVTSAVMACKATTKVNEILDKTKEDVEAIHKCEEDESMKEQYSSEDARILVIDNAPSTTDGPYNFANFTPV